MEKDETLANKARLLFRLDRPQDAIEALDRISDPEQKDTVAPLLAHGYLRIGRPSKAVEVLERRWVRGRATPHDIMLAEQLMHAYALSGEPDKADSVVADLLPILESHPEVASVVAQRWVAQGRVNEAVTLLSDAASRLTGRRAEWLKLQLANLYHEAGKETDAANLYDELVDAGSDLSARQRHVVSLYNAGRYQDAIARAEMYRGSTPVIPVISEIESLVLERMGDLVAARRILELLFDEKAPTPEQLARFASLSFRAGEPGRAADAVRRISFETIKNDADLLLNTAGLRVNLGLGGELPLLYQARRIAPGRADAHLGYVGAFLGLPPDDPLLATPEVVSVGSAVSVRSDNHEKTYVIVEEASDVRENELSKTDELARLIIGSRVGDKLSSRSGAIEAIEYEIVKIESKFVVAARGTLESFGARFPDDLGLQRVSVPEGDISKMLALVDRRQSAMAAALEEYRRAALPLGLIALRTGLGVFRTWALLISDSSELLWVSGGSVEEISQERAVALSATALALDASGLFTIKHLGIENQVRSRFDLLATQALIDSLMAAEARERSVRGPYMTVGKEGDRYVRTEVSAEAAERTAAFVSEAIAFVRSKTSVVPVKAALRAHAPREELVRQALGEQAFSAVSAARERSVPVLADDLGLRRVAESEFGVQSVSIQGVLMALRESSLLSPNEYHEAIGKLIAMRYRYLTVGSETILEALRQAHMEVTPAATSLCRVLEGPDTTLDSAIGVAVGVLKGVALESLTSSQRKLILDLVLNSLMTGRLREVVIPRLVAALRVSLGLLPVHLAEFEKTIAMWVERRDLLR